MLCNNYFYKFFSVVPTLYTTRCPMSTSVHMFDFFCPADSSFMWYFLYLPTHCWNQFFSQLLHFFSSHSWGVLINCLPPNKVSRSPQSRPHPPRLYMMYESLDLPQGKITANRLFIPSISWRVNTETKRCFSPNPKSLTGKSQLWHSVKVDSAWYRVAHGKCVGVKEVISMTYLCFSHLNKGSSVYMVLQLLGKIFWLFSPYCHWDTFSDRIY